MNFAPQEEQCGGVPSYEIDTAVQLSGLFENVALGVSADPTTVTLYLQNPAGAIQILSVPPVVRNDVGSYSYTFTPSASGTWTFKWRGVGSIVATTPDTTFVVNPSFVIAG